MLNPERRHPLEVMECLIRDIEYLRSTIARFETYSIPVLELVNVPCETLAREISELIAKKSRPILVKDSPHGPARLND